jgi:hypothetical protein
MIHDHQKGIGRHGQTELPKRGDACEAWLKSRRDSLLYGGTDQRDDTWQLLDELLEDYRRHADLGIPLSETVYDLPAEDDEAVQAIVDSLQEPLVTRMDYIL